MLINITVEVERSEGRNRSRDAVTQALLDEIENLLLEVEESSYDIVAVFETPAPPKARPPRRGLSHSPGERP